jgi:hypothetical protein
MYDCLYTTNCTLLLQKIGLWNILDLIECGIVKYKNLGDIILFGDFDARVGSMSDFIGIDYPNSLPLSDD